MIITQNNTNFAFKNNHDAYLRKIHLYLNKNYHKLIFNRDDKFDLTENDLYKLKQIECIWIEHEKSECFNKYDCYRKIKKLSDIQAVVKTHPAYQHSIFEYLYQHATVSDLKYFIKNDSVLNLEFFDYIAYALIGTSEEEKLEIMCSLWNESGKGCIKEFHTVKFKQLMTDMGLQYNRNAIIENMSWEGLAGINLFSYMSQYTSNKLKFFGVLAATEMLDQPHYYRIIHGLEKMNNSEEYILHTNTYMDNIVLSALREQPNRISEFWLGFYLRMDSVQRYYDKMLKYFHNRKKLVA